MKPQPPILSLCAAVLVLGLGIGPGQAQLISPFGRDQVELTPPEVAAMEKSIHDVLVSGKPGTVSSWKNDDTKRSGRSTLLKAYTRGNAKCGEVRHTVTRPTRADRNVSYTLPFCQQPDGSWKIAF